MRTWTTWRRFSHTPLTGSYNWDYKVQDDRIKKLYDLGKELNWNAEMDIDWDRPWPEDGLRCQMAA